MAVALPVILIAGASQDPSWITAVYTPVGIGPAMVAAFIISSAAVWLWNGSADRAVGLTSASSGLRKVHTDIKRSVSR